MCQALAVSFIDGPYDEEDADDGGPADGVCVLSREGEVEGLRFGDDGFEAEYDGDDGVPRRATNRVKIGRAHV